METIFKEIEEILKKMMEKSNGAILGWSNKIRDGKIRVYVAEEKAAEASLVKSLKIGGNEYQIEYYKVGRIRALGG